jgi:hypothetical protein
MPPSLFGSPPSPLNIGIEQELLVLRTIEQKVYSFCLLEAD